MAASKVVWMVELKARLRVASWAAELDDLTAEKMAGKKVERLAELMVVMTVALLVYIRVDL